MKNSRPTALPILKILRLAGLLLLVGSVASASAQTVKERLEKEPGFRVYPVVFGVTAATNGPPAIRLVEVGTIKGAPKIDTVPETFINTAKKKIEGEPPKPKMKDGKPAEIFTFFFYIPGHPDVVVVDLDKPLDKQP